MDVLKNCTTVLALTKVTSHSLLQHPLTNEGEMSARWDRNNTTRSYHTARKRQSLKSNSKKTEMIQFDCTTTSNKLLWNWRSVGNSYRNAPSWQVQL